MENVKQPVPLCCFGLITDVQYADIPNGSNYMKTKRRYYRDALEQLRRAVTQWKGHPHTVDFVVHLGDLIDGHNNGLPGASDLALTSCLNVFDDLPVHHVIGNHELYNFSREDILSGPLNTSKLPGVVKDCGNSRENCMFYQFEATKGLRIVVLDTYEITILGVDKESKEYKKAHDILRQFNRNDDPNDVYGVDKHKKMFAGYNGAISRHQMEWLERTLGEADKNKENVIIVGHQGVHRECGDITTLCWNCDEVLEVIKKYSSCVVAYFSGHDHDGDYHHDGIHYFTLPGVIEVPPETQAFITAEVYRDRIELIGSGCIRHHTIELKNQIIGCQSTP